MTAASTQPPQLDPEVVADDARLASALADGAGRALLHLRQAFDPADAAGLKAAGDRLGHGFLMAALQRYRPDDVVLSEEGRDDPARLRADRVWIVDPLDGTREFSEPPRTDWAIHVALWQRFPASPPRATVDQTGELTAAAVALPAQGLTLSTYDVEHSGVRERVASAPIPDRPRVLVSRTRPPVEAERVAAALAGELVPLGSAGAKVMAVVLGDADVYVHSGGQYEWDSAAPVAVASAGGLHCSRIDGSTLLYNQKDVSLPDLVVCRPELASAVLEAAAG